MGRAGLADDGAVWGLKEHSGFQLGLVCQHLSLTSFLSLVRNDLKRYPHESVMKIGIFPLSIFSLMRWNRWLKCFDQL